MRLALLLLAACAGGTSPPADGPAPVAPADPAAAPSADPQVEHPPIDVSGEEALLASGPPAGGAYLKMMQGLAAEVGAGVVRCPLSGGGRAQVYRGGPEEHYLTYGMTMRLEERPPRAWSHVYEEVLAEDQWLAFLAPTTATGTTVVTRDRALRMEHPAPKAGETVSCTKVRPAYPRAVHGKVKDPAPEAKYLVFPCLDTPAQVGGDGTFAFEVVPPCTFWVEGNGTRTDPVRVEPDPRALRIELALHPDPWQGPDGVTPAGVKAVAAMLGALRKEDAATLAKVEALDAEFGTVPEIHTLLKRWRAVLADREILAKKVEAGGIRPDLGEPPAPTP